MEAIKTFTGKLNLDASPEFLPDGDYSYLRDGITRRNGKAGVIENMLGFNSFGATDVDSSSVPIGSIKDHSTQDVYTFFYHPNPIYNTIVKYNGTATSKVATWSGFNFSNNIQNRVQGCFVNGYLYWADNINDIRCMSVTKYNVTAPSSAEEIVLIKRGGIYSPTTTKMSDGVAVSLIGKNEFQFVYQYVYEGNELSVVSPYSELVHRSEAHNKIRVTVPTSETIPENVKEIKFGVRLGNDVGFRYIGNVPRSLDNFATKYVDFYNTVYGSAIGTDYLSLYHDIPLKARTVELIRNRLWVGNVKEGYNLPSAIPITVGSSIQGTIVEGTPNVAPATFYYITRWDYTTVDNGNGTRTTTNTNIQSAYAVLYAASQSDSDRDVSGTAVTFVSGAYELGSGASYNGDLDLSILGQGIVPFGAFPNRTTGGSGTPSYTVYQIGSSFTANLRTTVSEATVNSYVGLKTFPNGSRYQVGIVYKDRYGRTSSVLKAASDLLTSDTTYNAIINGTWSLPSGVQLNIPDWAESYHIVMTRNLSKAFFMEWSAARVNYYKDTALTTPYSADNTGIKIDITPILNSGAGYSYENGDRVVLFNPDGVATYNIQIKGLESGNLLLPNTNIGTITNQNCIIEIYRPASIPDTMLFYEIGKGYPISNAGTASRFFSTTSGTLDGDCITTKKPVYTWATDVYSTAIDGIYKSMSLDITSSEWASDYGKPHLILTVGQRDRKSNFRHSLPIIINTEINGLSEFYSSDQADLPIESGELFKLKAATRSSAEGTVLLALCKNRAMSIYVDEARIRLDAQTSYLISGSQVIGDVQPLSGDWGTSHPDSVVDDGKHVYWFCVDKSAFVRYASNGVFPISEQGIISHCQKVTDLDLSSTLIISGYSPRYRLVYFTVNNGSLTDKTITYDIDEEGWRTFIQSEAQLYIDHPNTFTYINNGLFYKMGSETTRTIPIVETFVNVAPNMPKTWETISLALSDDMIVWDAGNGDQKSSTTNLNAVLTDPDGKVTDCQWDEFDFSDDIAYSPIMGATNSSGGYLEGVELYGRYLKVRIAFGIITQKSSLTLIKVGYSIASGHSI